MKIKLNKDENEKDEFLMATMTVSKALRNLHRLYGRNTFKMFLMAKVIGLESLNSSCLSYILLSVPSIP